MCQEENYSPDEQCGTQNMTLGEDFIDAVVCHCYDSLCNDHIPQLPTSIVVPTVTTTSSGKESLTSNILMMLTSYFLYGFGKFLVAREDRMD